MTPPASALVDRDSEHLKLLSVFHYVLSGISALLGCFPIFHLMIGLVFVYAPAAFPQSKDQPPSWFGWIFVVMASLLILAAWTYSLLVFFAGRFLAQRRRILFAW